MAREADPARVPLRVRRDAQLRTEIQKFWQETFSVYGARKVWLQPVREGTHRGQMHGRALDARCGSQGRCERQAQPCDNGSR